MGANATITVAVSQAPPPPIVQNVTVSPTNSTDGNFTVHWDPSTGATEKVLLVLASISATPSGCR